MTAFKKHFFELWEAEGQAIGDIGEENRVRLVELCALVHEEPSGRLEFQWSPEHPTCQREAVARKVFNQALQLASRDINETTSPPFAVIEPIVGHVAVKLFCEKAEFWRDVREVAFVRPIIDGDKYIG